MQKTSSQTCDQSRKTPSQRRDHDILGHLMVHSLLSLRVPAIKLERLSGKKERNLMFTLTLRLKGFPAKNTNTKYKYGIEQQMQHNSKKVWKGHSSMKE